MYLAAQPSTPLAGTLVPLAGGMSGVWQTVAAMRAMVRSYRTDPRIRHAAASIVQLQRERDGAGEAQALLSWMQACVRYVADVHQVETLTTPDRVLELRYGDCDDQATLLATLLESIGYPTRFVVAGYVTPGEVEHVYLQALIGGQWLDMDPTERYPVGMAPPDPVTIHHERT